MAKCIEKMGKTVEEAVELALNKSKLQEWGCGLCWGRAGEWTGLLPSLSEAFILLCLILPPDCLLLLLSAVGSIKRNSLLKEGHLQTLLNGGRQSCRVTPFWYRTRVMKKELASEAGAHALAQPPSRPPAPPPNPVSPSPPPPASLTRSPAAGTLRCIYYFSPHCLGLPQPLPEPLHSSGPPPSPAAPPARPPPASSLSHNSILFTETNCPASGCT